MAYGSTYSTYWFCTDYMLMDKFIMNSTKPLNLTIDHMYGWKRI